MEGNLTVVSDQTFKVFKRLRTTQALDLSKNFDMVWHHGIHCKCNCHKTSGWVCGLKACVHYFSVFHHMIALLYNYEKCFLFHLKSSFRSRDIQDVVFPSFPLFFPVRYYFRWLLKINLKVYDVINCLNKNLLTQFFDILRRKKAITLKLYQLIEY